MGDFSGPITGCFRVVIAIIIIVLVSVFLYHKHYTEEKEKKIYQQGRYDESKIINHKVDSILKTK